MNDSAAITLTYGQWREIERGLTILQTKLLKNTSTDPERIAHRLDVVDGLLETVKATLTAISLENKALKAAASQESQVET